MSAKLIKLQNARLALRADSGLALGNIYPLSSDRNIIGRSVDVGVPVDDSKVSRVHASIDLQNGFHYLVDLGSTNGTYLNGVRIQNAALLSVGDEVRVGSAVFKVELLDQAKQQVSDHWRESTRAIVILDPSIKRVPEKKSLSKEDFIEPVTKWFHLKQKILGTLKTFMDEHGKIVVMVFATGLVLAAMSVSFF